MPFGYVMQRTSPDAHGIARFDGQPKPHPDAAQIVARIFQRSAEGASGFAIARELNEEGISSPGATSGSKPGSRWATRQVMVVLRRKEYATGEITVGANVVRCEPLVSREVFASANRRLSKRTAAGPRKAGNFPLTGLAFCGTCGAPLSGSSVSKNRYMRCSGASRCPGSCTGTYVAEKPLLDAAVATITEAMLTESAWDALRAAVETELQRGRADRPDTSRLEKKLAELNAKIEKAGRRLFDCPDDLLPEATAALRALKADRDALASQVTATAPREAFDVRAETERALANLSRLRDELGSGDSIRLRAALGELVERVDVSITKEGSRRTRRGIITFRPLADCSPRQDAKNAKGRKRSREGAEKEEVRQGCANVGHGCRGGDWARGISSASPHLRVKLPSLPRWPGSGFRTLRVGFGIGRSKGEMRTKGSPPPQPSPRVGGSRERVCGPVCDAVRPCWRRGVAALGLSWRVEYVRLVVLMHSKGVYRHADIPTVGSEVGTVRCLSRLRCCPFGGTIQRREPAGGREECPSVAKPS